MNPIAWFHQDRAQARTKGDPCAELCALATVNADGAPAVRTLVLRDLEGESPPDQAEAEVRLAVFINDSSPKWPAMQRVSALVYLPSLKVQYRLSCTSEPVPEALVHSRWQERPDAPKRMDWYYAQRPQSSPVASRKQLLDEVEGLKVPSPLIAPSSARGLYLNPFDIERLDLNQANGIHDRRRWHRPAPSSPRVGEPPKANAQPAASILDGGWTQATLVP